MSGEKVVVRGAKYSVVRRMDGYSQLSPLPTERELDDFYKNKYYELIKKGGRAPELKLQMKRDKDAVRERKWLQANLYEDIIAIIRKNQDQKAVRLLDIGCGTGEMIKYMARRGFETAGIEPHEKKKDFQRVKGMTVFSGTLAEAAVARVEWVGFFDVVTIMSVLEHVSNPDEVIAQAIDFLNPERGLICIRVPNDFNPLQAFAQKVLKNKPWWIAVPDHLNYFSVDTLKKYLLMRGLDIVDVMTDFPMELFLLFGDNYIGKPDVGKECHRKRMAFESAVDPEFRRSLYRMMAGMGIGRDVMVFARPRKAR